MSIILHDFALSSASYRVRIALNLKGLAFQKVNYVLRRGDQRSNEYLAVNPAGLVPTLEIDGEKIHQSLAIIDYLEARWPEPRLVPERAKLRAKALAIAYVVACDIHPLNNLRVLQYLDVDLGVDEPARNAWYRHWVHAGFVAIETLLRDLPPVPFAFGERPSIVELSLVPQLFNARRFGVELDAYPQLVELADRAAELPEFQSAAPAAA